MHTLSQHPITPPHPTLSIHSTHSIIPGNLAYTIDDEAMIEFFKDCGALVGLRWLTHKGDNNHMYI